MTLTACKSEPCADAHGGEFENNLTSKSSSSENVPGTLLDRIYYQREKPVLDLSLCMISKVPLDAIHTYYREDVQSLDLSFNAIRSLSPLFARKLVTLTKLDLSRNMLKQLPDNFGLLDQLTYLDIHQNQLETLPLSMGKLRRLQFLNLSDNPFRSPLCNILSSGHLRSNRRLGRVESAHCIVRFLAELNSEIYTSGDGTAVALPQQLAPRRGVTFESDNEEPMMGPLKEDGRIRHRRRISEGRMRQRVKVPTRTRAVTSLSQTDQPPPNQMSPWSMLILSCVVAVLLVMMIPLVTALFCGTDTLEHGVQTHPQWTKVWNNYRYFHESANDVLNFVGMTEDHRPIYYRQPPLPPAEQGNIFQIAYRKIADAINLMLSLIWG